MAHPDAFWPITRMTTHEYPHTDANPPDCVGMRIVGVLKYPHTDINPPVCGGTGIVGVPEYPRTDASVPVCGVTARASG